jgi:hypothetical protein
VKETTIRIPCEVERIRGSGFRARALGQECTGATETEAKSVLTDWLIAHASVDQTPRIHVSDIGDVWIVQRTGPDAMSVSRIQRTPTMYLQPAPGQTLTRYSREDVYRVQVQIWESTAAYQFVMFFWCLATGRRYVTCPHCRAFNGAVRVPADDQSIRCSNPGCHLVIDLA